MMVDITKGFDFCEICGSLYQKKSEGVCVKPEFLCADTLWDYMNCPRCGCQIILRRRYRDKNDPYFMKTSLPELQEDTNNVPCDGAL